MNRCVRCRVRGRVQGVFYRASTRDKAWELGLTGWVRNARDGSVELLACGTDVAVRALGQWLREGPPGARVESVECEVAEDPEAGDFVVKY